LPHLVIDYISTAGSGQWAGANAQYSTTTPFAYIGTNYLSESTYKGEFVVFKLPVAIAITSYTIYQVQSTTGRTRAPKHFKICGSNNGTTWFIIQTITNATYTNDLYTNTQLSTNTTTYLYYGMVINQITGNGGLTQIAEWIINGKEQLENLTDSTSGGSGGGGFGNILITQNGAVAGTPFNITHSKITNGYNGTTTQGGNGGSALISGDGYSEVITGSNIIVGKGGTGATSSSIPSTKTNYGDGGDGNNGYAFQGVVIIKIPPLINKTNFTGFTDWGKVENVLTSFPLSNSIANT
jgi:hypothetical protein